MRKTYQTRRSRRRAKIRAKVKGTAGQPRLVVFRSNKHIYSQIIDDKMGKTLVAASESELKSDKKRATPRKLKSKEGTESKTERAKVVGQLLAQKALKKGIKKVVFDRAGYQYHGRVKALAEGARESGLKF